MKLDFGSKKNSKALQESEFLALSPDERFASFLELSFSMAKLYGKPKEVKSKSYEIKPPQKSAWPGIKK